MLVGKREKRKGEEGRKKNMARSKQRGEKNYQLTTANAMIK